MEPIIISTLINADATKVWNYYTQPEHITQWNFADPSWHCPHASNDMRIGGQYLARMEAKDGSFGFDLTAIYDEIITGKSFAYTFPDKRIVTVVFKPIEQQTEVTISFDPEQINAPELQRAGWQSILNNFKKYTEEN